MHPVQQKIMNLFSNTDTLDLRLREIGRIISVIHPQTVKYHLLDLARRGLIKIDLENKKLILIDHSAIENGPLLTLPIYGSANCGAASVFAENSIEGFLKVSKNILKGPTENLFVLKATGNSMDRAVINGKNIEDDDFVIVDGSYIDPKNYDYIVSIIDGCANIKKFLRDEQNEQIVLFSESSQDFLPIYIHQDDSYQIAGKVTQVIKNPKNMILSSS
jgi:SOS-response transcriptional repressor LexA